MKLSCRFLIFMVLLSSTPALLAQSVSITSLSERQIIQRDGSNQADIPVAGTYSGGITSIEARVVVMGGPEDNGTPLGWQVIDSSPSGGTYNSSLTLPAGGFYQVEVRTMNGASVVTNTSVSRVGVGDIYLMAGQSNSANWGSPRQTSTSDRVSERTSYSGNTWVHASDPQDLAGGTNGSPWPILGDMLVQQNDVPVGIISVGVGATTVQQWVDSYYNSRLRPVIQSLGTDGFAAILWHQGESDSLAGTSSLTYQARLESIIASSRSDAGFDVPWGVALASFHPSSSSPAEAQIIAGQQLVIDGDTLVFEGAFTDDFLALGYLHDGVHFNQAGLDEHASRWLAAINAVPEPASILFVMTGMAGLLRVSRRQKTRRRVNE